MTESIQTAVRLRDGFEKRPHIPPPKGSAHLDRMTYRSVHFYGSQLHSPLQQAASYLREIEESLGSPANVVCLHDEFSWEDQGTDLAWRLTVVVGEPIQMEDR